MKLISCSLTQSQILDHSKTETRRLKCLKVKAGDFLLIVDRVMGFKKGERPKPLALVQVIEVRREPLDNILPDAVVREGFPNLTPDEFVQMFVKNMRCDYREMITVIRWRYIPPGPFIRNEAINGKPKQGKSSALLKS